MKYVGVEATAAYEWFFLLIEDLADRLVLAHPKKLRVIAESTRKEEKFLEEGRRESEWAGRADLGSDPDSDPVGGLMRPTRVRVNGGAALHSGIMATSLWRRSRIDG